MAWLYVCRDLPRSCAESFLRILRAGGNGCFGRGEYHENDQILRDGVEPVIGAGWDKNNIAGFECAVFESAVVLANGHAGRAGDDVIDFVFGVRGLFVFGSRGKSVEAATERRDAEEFEIRAATGNALTKKIFDAVEG